MNARVLGLLVLLVTLLPGSAAGDDDGLLDGESVVEIDAAFPGAVPLDAAGEETVWCVRIVDAVDRRPIPGALVAVPAHPGGGVPDAELHVQCAGVADWDGWVRLPWPAVRGWVDYAFADAPGYAANEHCRPGDVECELERGVDVPVVVLDYTGLPVPHARIALNLGCGHVPDQRTAVTDAEGRAVLQDVLPSRHEDIWIVAQGCHRGTSRLRRTWRPGDPPVAIDAVPGITVSGRVLGPDGAPVPHALVGERDLHRPWTTTDRDGRFRLVGVGAWSDIEVDAPLDLGFDELHFTAPPEGVDRVLVLGEATDGVLVEVVVFGPEDEAGAGVRVALVRRTDGLTVTGRTDANGEVKLDVAPGSYRVLADGELGTWGKAEAAVEVHADVPGLIDLVVPRNPTVRVDASRVLDQRAGLTTRRGFRALTWDDAEDLHAVEVPVPTDERAVFRISGDMDGELLVAYVQAPAAGGTVTLDWVPVTRLTGRLVGPDGRPVPGVLRVWRERWFLDRFGPEEDEAATAAPDVSAATRLVGTVAWIATPLDEGLAEAHGDVRLAPGGGTVDLGEIRLTGRAVGQIRLDLPADLRDEVDRANVALRGPGVREALHAELREDGTLDPEDVGDWPSLGAGAELEISFEGLPVLPVRYVTPGGPPWVIAWPTATLSLDVRSEGGERLEGAVVFVDGESLGQAWRDGAPIEVRAVGAGWHTVVVAERDHVAKRYRLRVQEGETRTLGVSLRPRGG